MSDPAIRAALRSACNAERAHDGASPCHACPDGCSNADLAAGIAGFLRALHRMTPLGVIETRGGETYTADCDRLALAVEEAANA